MIRNKLYNFITILLLLKLNENVLSSSNPLIIVIGAGPSGLAAATRLLENNFTDILVLEAENRIGGRINSVKFGDAFVDVGAEWCHGKEDNIVYSLVEDLGILRPAKLGSPPIYYSKGRQLNKTFTDELFDVYGEIYTPGGIKDEKEGIDLGTHCTNRFTTGISEKFSNDPENYKLARSSLYLFEKYILANEGAFSWFDPSAVSDFKKCDGDDYNWSGHGYKTILDTIIKKLPDYKQKILTESILLNKEVNKIIWNKNKINPSDVTIKCSDGSVYSAKHVIFTPSLGVLKNDHQNLFMPQLSMEKQEVINKLGIGAVMKIILHFPTRWWLTERFQQNIFLWDENDLPNIANEFPEGYTEDGKIWVKDLVGFMPLENNTQVLTGWVTGNLIPYIEQLNDETVLNGCMFVLKKFLGHKYNITRPDQMIRTKWYTNPHFRGTYSYQTVESRKLARSPEQMLAEPLMNNEKSPALLFAGEATHPYFYSTVHGAIETGYREANRLTNLYK